MCLLLLFWLALAGYVLIEKKSLLEKARTQIRDRTGGAVKIGQLDISLFRHFPDITLRLSDVTLRDSGWDQHHHDLLHAADVYISASLFRSLFKRRIELSRVFLEHGTVYFFTDSTGYSNTYLLKDRSQSGSAEKGKDQAGLPAVTLSDMKWVLEMQDRHKLFDLDIRHLDAVIAREDRSLRFGIKSEIKVNSFAFNTEKGSFVKDKILTGSFTLSYNRASKIVQFEKASLQIDGHPFVFSGRFFPTVKPDPFLLIIETDHLLFRKATALLTPNLQQKLDEYDIDRPVSVHVQLDAGAADDPMPNIQIRLNLDNGSVLTPAGRFTGTSFQGTFTNEWMHGRKREDENSGLRLRAFSGQLDNIPLRAETIDITDLRHPRLSCDLHAQFALNVLNDLYGSQTLQFQKGSCNMDLRYKGPLSENDTAGTTVNGHLDVDSAAISYLPYDFELTNCKGRLLFKEQDLIIENLEARTGSSKFRVKGVAKNLVALLDQNAENVSMNWTLVSPHLNLEDFAVLAGRPAEGAGVAGGAGGAGGARATKRSGGSALGAAATRIDHFLKEGLIRVHLEAGDISYQHFSGAHAMADMVFDNSVIRLNHLSVEQGPGSLDLRAILTRRPEGDANPLTLESHLENVDLPKIFMSFDNFGQQALISRNLKGRLNADIRMTCKLTNKAAVVPNSLKGSVNFSILDGQLVDFEPMEKIHETVLKKRDLSEIRFAELQNQLDIDSTTVRLHRMEIQSTMFTLFAEGIYDLKKGADMSLQIPLSNLKKRDANIPPESKGNNSKAGLSLRLRAKTGNDGKLKISWDPFKKALKKGKR